MHSSMGITMGTLTLDVVVLQVEWGDPVSLTGSFSLVCTLYYYVNDTELPRKSYIFAVFASSGDQERTVFFSSLDASFKVPFTFLVCRKLILQIGSAAMTGSNGSPPS